MYKKALVSVWDKTGLEAFLRPLTNQGLKLVSTGGTAQFLRSKAFQVTDIQDLTAFPEVLEGRVKTLHPHIYMPLLARSWAYQDQKLLNQYGLTPFDLVVGNLYPFEAKEKGLKEKERAEWIDVGGPSFLRAAAKNYFSVTVICDPEDYPLAQKGADLQKRKQLAVKVFERLSQYDSIIAQSLKSHDQSLGKKEAELQKKGGFLSNKNQTPSKINDSFKSINNKNQPPSKINDSFESADNQNQAPSKAGASFESAGQTTSLFLDLKQSGAKKEFSFKGRFFKKLRYGENPHQPALWLTSEAEGLHLAQKIQGKALSYNNLLDLWTAVSAVRDFKEPCAVAVKHNNPCGVAVANQLSLAVEKALKADPLSVFGGLLAFNRLLDRASAKKLAHLFLEALIAPDFSPSALEILKDKKNLRILKWPEMLSYSPPLNSVCEIAGGFLIQKRDRARLCWTKDWKIIGDKPSEEMKNHLLFAWKVCSHLKSNAIAVTKKGQTLGLGTGQTSRVFAVKSALDRAKEFHPSEKKDLILASEAFFPFSDSIELAHKGGVSWIIQPGGSIKDEKVIKKALELGLSMVLTGERHFKH